jgi:hypothetical protein
MNVQYLNCAESDVYTLKTHFLVIIDNRTQVKLVINRPNSNNDDTLSQWVAYFFEGRACTVIMAPYQSDDAMTEATYSKIDHLKWARALQWQDQSDQGIYSMQMFQHSVALYTPKNGLNAHLHNQANPVSICKALILTEEQLLKSSARSKSRLHTKFRTTQSALDVFIVALLGAIGISAIIMSPVGLPFIVVVSILLASIIGALGLGIGRFCVNENSKMNPLHYLSMTFKGGGMVITTFTLCNACGVLSLSPALQISLLCVMAVAMVGVAIIDYKLTTLNQSASSFKLNDVQQ